MEIKILGVGCAKCKKMETIINQALKRLKISVSINKIEDRKEIAVYGVLSPPGLVINNKLVLSGRVPSVEEVEVLISQNVI